MFPKLRSLFLLPGLLLLGPLHANAVRTIFWRSSGVQVFGQDHIRGLSLGQDGRLTVAPSLRLILPSGQAMLWSAAVDPAGNVYLGSGHLGRIYRLTPAMLQSAKPVDPARALWFTTPEPEVLALTVGPDGALYAGTSPNGKVYRIAADGKSSVYFNPHQQYIWALTFHGRDLYIGTGSQGLIDRVTAPGKGAVFFATRERDVMTLAWQGHGRLLAGTDPDGLVFSIPQPATESTPLAGRSQVKKSRNSAGRLAGVRGRSAAAASSSRRRWSQRRSGAQERWALRPLPAEPPAPSLRAATKAMATMRPSRRVQSSHLTAPEAASPFRIRRPWKESALAKLQACRLTAAVACQGWFPSPFALPAALRAVRPAAAESWRRARWHSVR